MWGLPDGSTSSRRCPSVPGRGWGAAAGERARELVPCPAVVLRAARWSGLPRRRSPFRAPLRRWGTGRGLAGEARGGRDGLGRRAGLFPTGLPSRPALAVGTGPGPRMPPPPWQFFVQVPPWRRAWTGPGSRCWKSVTLSALVCLRTFGSLPLPYVSIHCQHHTDWRLWLYRKI